MSPRVRVLFVCMGNICRSPTAEGAFRKLLDKQQLAGLVGVDSAGTHDYHAGSPPDTRAQTTARDRGVDLSALRARQVRAEDFELFDYVVAMDRSNRAVLEAACPRHLRQKISLLLQYCDGTPDEVPDPYYGGPGGFDKVFDLVEEGAQALLLTIRQQRLS